MAMPEAAGVGTTVVTGAACGLPHIGELFAGGEDAVIIPAGPRPERIRRYVHALGALIRDPAMARMFARKAQERSAGRLADRNRRLLAHYDEMFEMVERMPAGVRSLAADGPTDVIGPDGTARWKSSVDLSLLDAVHDHRWANGAASHLTFQDDGLRPVE